MAEQLRKMSQESSDFLIAEFTELRTEMVKRIELQHQLFLAAVVTSGTLLGVGFQNQARAVILLYPLLALFLSCVWLQSHVQIRLQGKYIENIEKELLDAGLVEKGMGWQQGRLARGLGRRRPSISLFVAVAIFAGTQVMTVVLVCGAKWRYGQVLIRRKPRTYFREGRHGLTITPFCTAN